MAGCSERQIADKIVDIASSVRLDLVLTLARGSAWLRLQVAMVRARCRVSRRCGGRARWAKEAGPTPTGDGSSGSVSRGGRRLPGEEMTGRGLLEIME